MAFGDRLSELLEERGLSQKKFAAILNIAPTTLNGYIKNKRQPDFELVKRIAFILNVSTDYLLEYDGGGINLTVQELSVILKLREINDEQRELITELIDLSARKNKKQNNTHYEN